MDKINHTYIFVTLANAFTAGKLGTLLMLRVSLLLPLCRARVHVTTHVVAANVAVRTCNAPEQQVHPLTQRRQASLSASPTPTPRHNETDNQQSWTQRPHCYRRCALVTAVPANPHQGHRSRTKQRPCHLRTKGGKHSIHESSGGTGATAPHRQGDTQQPQQPLINATGHFQRRHRKPARQPTNTITSFTKTTQSSPQSSTNHLLSPQLPPHTHCGLVSSATASHDKQHPRPASDRYVCAVMLPPPPHSFLFFLWFLIF